MAQQSKAKSSSEAASLEQRLSMAMENYLLSIVRMGEQDVRVTLTVLAEHLKTLPLGEGLGTTLPTVGGMIRRMAREGLVETNSNKDVILTKIGRKFAENILRRHRLAERMVVDVFGLDLEYAHEEAHRLEHAISPQLEELINEKLGNPTTCPFGHPIPGSSYVPDKRRTTLDQASTGTTMIIDCIPEDNQDLLEYFVENKLIPGQLITINEVSEPRRIIRLECGGSEVVFGYDVGTKIWVCPE